MGGMLGKMGFDGRGHRQAPLGGSYPKLSVLQKRFQVGLGRLQQEVAQKLGPHHSNEYGSNGSPPLCPDRPAYGCARVLSAGRVQKWL